MSAQELPPPPTDDDAPPLPRRRRLAAAPTPERIPPHNLDAEQSVLGAILLGRLYAEQLSPMDAVLQLGVTADDFYRPAHKHVFDAMLRLHLDAQPTDSVTVADALRRAGLLDDIGGGAFLLELQSATPSVSNAAHYAQIVRDCAALRTLILTAGQISEVAYSNIEPGDAIRQAVELVNEASFGAVAGGTAGRRDHELSGLMMRGFGLEDLPPQEYLLEPALQTNSLAVLFGPSGAGKTFAAIDIACSVASGIEKWHGCPILRSGPVLYLAAEPTGMADRIRAWAQFHAGGLEPVDLFILPRAVGLHDLEVDAPTVARIAKRIGAVLVVIDTLARNTVGLDENSNTEMNGAVNGMDLIRQETGACVMAVHHVGHGERKRMRGASGLYTAVDTVIALESIGPELIVSTQYEKGGKQRGDSDDWRIQLTRESVRVPSGKTNLVLTSRTLGELPGAQAEQITLAHMETLEALKAIVIDDGPVTSGDWLISSKLERWTFQRHRKALVEAGLVILSGGTKNNPRYLPASGEVV